jgi:hypothetical protein
MLAFHAIVKRVNPSFHIGLCGLIRDEQVVLDRAPV